MQRFVFACPTRDERISEMAREGRVKIAVLSDTFHHMHWYPAAAGQHGS